MSNRSAKQNSSPQGFVDPNFVNPVYPVDDAAERGLSAALLDSPNLLPEAWSLLGNPLAVANDAYRAIIKTMVELQEENKTVKISSILQRLRKSGELELLQERRIDLMNLHKEATTTDTLETCLYLRGLWVKRTAIDAASDILRSVSAGEAVDVISDKAAQLQESIASGMSVGQDRSNADVVREWFVDLENGLKNAGKLAGVEQGSDKLNRHLGGWKDTDVIMLAGRPGSGKTVIAAHHAMAAAESGTPVAYVSLEMPAKSIISRLVSAMTGIQYADIINRRITEPWQWTKIHQAIGQIENLPIHWYDDAERDVSEISYKLIEWKRKHKLGLVIIDYVQLLEDRTVRSTNEYETLTSISKKLKKLQRRLQLPLVEVAQLNRSVEARTSRRATMADLRGTGQFEQDASLIVMLFREDYYAEEKAQEDAKQTGRYVKPERNHKFEYNVVKNREGYLGMFALHVDVATNQVFDSSELANAVHSQQAGFTTTTINRFPQDAGKNWYDPKDKADF
jgi:replicative DNA helicase